MNEIVTYRVDFGEQTKDFQTLIEARFYRDQIHSFGWVKTPIIRIVTQVISYSIVVEDNHPNDQTTNADEKTWSGFKPEYNAFGKDFNNEIINTNLANINPIKRAKNSSTTETTPDVISFKI